MEIKLEKEGRRERGKRRKEHTEEGVEIRKRTYWKREGKEREGGRKEGKEINMVDVKMK